MICLKRKRHLFEAKKLKARAKKAMSSRHSAYIPPSVKSPLVLSERGLSPEICH